ncbi:MAG: Alpha-D-glucose 1-phosphate phosphatase YihX [Verrucomicrobiae bacterium]|nr:Alpha-D-glucose 1-phosphate phosphatase YihX [Verrucomicrobiae bacterium]
MTGVDAVIFDLGNVLISVNEARAADRFAARTGKSSADIHAYFLTTPHSTELALGKITKRQFYWTVAKDLGFTGDYDELAMIWSDIFAPIPDMIELAQSLAGRRPRLILSNTNVIHADFFLERYPWINEFDAVILSHEVGLLKPDAAIYKLAVQRTGLPAERCVFIDDLTANVQGAQAAGLQAIHHQNPVQTRAELTKLGVLTI